MDMPCSTPRRRNCGSLRRPASRAALTFAAVALAGCATLSPVERLTLDQLVARAKQGENVEALVAAVRAQPAAYGLTGSDFARLHAQGVPERVLDELQRLEIAKAEERERLLRWEAPWPYRPWRFWPHPHVIVVKPQPKKP